MAEKQLCRQRIHTDILLSIVAKIEVQKYLRFGQVKNEENHEKSELEMQCGGGNEMKIS